MRPIRLRATSKYSAESTMVDGIRFASNAEARRYLELKLLLRAGEIRDLVLQPAFPLLAPGPNGSVERVQIGKYVADFRYRQGPRGVLVTEDVKGVRTALYRWKKKHFEAQYGHAITEISR